MVKKNILIFGAAGFIGTYLIDELIKLEYNVFASDISEIGSKYYNDNKIQYFIVNITKQEEFKILPQIKFDAIIHLAATQPANISAKYYNPKDYINVNVIGTLNILEFCRNNGADKIIYASSHRNTQGLWKNSEPLSEEDGREIKYTGQYSMFSISESAAQDCVLHYNAQYGIHSIIFRLPPVYGYGPHTEIFMDGKPIKTGFQIFIDNALECKPLEIWGDSSKGRDIIYIKDVVSAFLKALENDKAKGLYNIASGYYLTLKEEAETIAKVFWGNDNEPIIIERPDKPNNIDSFVYNIDKAKKEFGWIPKFNFENILYDYIKESKNKKFSFLIEKRKKIFKEN